MSGGPYAPIQSLAPGTTTFIDGGRVNGTTYFYVVNAQFSAGTSLNSNQAYATPSAPGPANLTATPGNAVVNLAWGAVTPLTNYNVKRSHSSSGPWITLASPTATTYADHSVTNGTTYFYTVSAVNASGETANSNVATATPAFPPSAPYALYATAGNAQVALTWVVIGGSVSYNIKRSTTTGTGYNLVATIPADLLRGAYTDHTAANGTTYFYVVSAVNAGGESGNSNEATATPEAPPAAPTGLTATPGNAQVILNYAAADITAYYNIYRGANSGGPYSLIAQFNTPALPNGSGEHWSWTDFGEDLIINTGTGLSNGSTYYYVVTGVNVGGESNYSNQAYAMPILPLPSVPVISRAQAGDLSAILYWSPSYNATSYNIYRSSVSGQGYVQVGATSISHQTFADGGRTNGVPYYYVVTGVNATGESAPSQEVVVVPMAAILNSSSVVSTATTFLTSIGIDPTVAGIAQYPAPLLSYSDRDSYWQPCWLVTFGSDYEVKVSDVSGIITYFYNDNLEAQLSTNPAGTAIAQSLALQKAATVMSATGIPNSEYGAPVETEIQLDTPATQAGHSIEVEYPRQFQSILYQNQLMGATFQAETGTILSMGVTSPSPAPTTFLNNVTSGQADQTAQAALASGGFVGLTKISNNLAVVIPNQFWVNGSKTPILGSSRVAWSDIYGDSFGNTYEVDVDRETGAIVRGIIAYIKSHRIPKHLQSIITTKQRIAHIRGLAPTPNRIKVHGFRMRKHRVNNK